MPTTTADTPQQGPSLEDAAKQFEGLLDLQDTEGNRETSDAAADAARTKNGESVAAEETSKETPADEETQAEETEAPETEGETDATEERLPTITVTVDGKKEEISLDEAAKGYQRWSDYSRKTEALAADRKKFETEQSAVHEERQTYATMLAALRDQLKTNQPEEPDWDEVYRQDPVGYARKRDEWRDRQEKLAAADFELRRVQGEQEKQRVEDFRKAVAANREKMLEMNPAWKDAKVWDADRQGIVEFARSMKYSDEEIAQAMDHRAIVIFDMARRWKELQGNKPKPVQTNGPRVASAGPAASTGNANRLNAAQQRLAKSGRVGDAAKVFEQLI